MTTTTSPSSRRLRVTAALAGASLLTGAGYLGGAAPRHASAAPSAAQGGTIIAGEAEAPDYLNPYLAQQLSSADIVGGVYDSLVLLNDKNEFTPDLASSYTHDAQGLHWTFNLNPKATWQDGVPVTSDDVLYTTALVTNPKFPATFTGGFDHIKTIKAAGKYRVDITLTSVYAPFLQYWGGAAILPKHIYSKYAPGKINTLTALDRKPVGTGPFRVTEYVSGDHITEVANKNYFRGAPHLDKLIFRIVPSNNTAVNQIQTGELNLLGQTSNISARQFNQLKTISGITAYNTQGFNWSHLDLIETGFLKDRTVRHALAYATPKQQIINTVDLGYGVPADADQAPGSTFYNPAVRNSYPYSIAKAKSVLEADGFKLGSNGYYQKGGKELDLALYGGAGSTSSKLTTQILKQVYGQAGINVTIKLLDSATLFGRSGPLASPQRFSAATPAAVLYEWVATSEPDSTSLWSSTMIPRTATAVGNNYDGYMDPAVDSLLKKGVATADRAARVPIYQHIQLLLAQDQPDIFLAWGRVLTAATSKLHGYAPNPYNYVLTWNVKDWSMQ